MPLCSERYVLGLPQFEDKHCNGLGLAKCVAISNDGRQPSHFEPTSLNGLQ